MKTRIDFICEAFASVGILLQTNEILQTILAILNCLCILVSLIYTVLKWYKLSMQDGKLDEQEIDELTEIFKETIKKDGNNKHE